MSINADVTVVPGRRVADLLAAGASDLGETTISDALSGVAVAAADVGDSLVIVSSLQLAAGLAVLSTTLRADVYQAVIGETGDGYAFMAVTQAGSRTRAFNDGVEVHVAGDPLDVEADLPDLDTDALVELLCRVEPGLNLADDVLDASATAVDVEALLGP